MTRKAQLSVLLLGGALTALVIWTVMRGRRLGEGRGPASARAQSESPRPGVDEEVVLEGAPARPCTSVAQDCLPALDLLDLHGVAYPASARAGKVVVVNFWSTYCEPCLREIPAFAATQTRLASAGVEFVGMLDDDLSVREALEISADLGMTYPSVLVDDKILAAYASPKKIPTTFVFDRRGALQLAHVGPLSEPALAAVLEPLAEAP